MTTPTCPPGTVQVGITTVRYPEGDKTCIICKDCEPPQIADCWPDGTYFNETGWAYLAREQTWAAVISGGSTECVFTDIEYEPSGTSTSGGNVYVYPSVGVVGTDSIGRTWEAFSTETISSGLLPCNQPASAEKIGVRLKNADGTFDTYAGAFDPDVVAGGFSFTIKTWAYGVVVGYGNTFEEADLNAFAQIPGLS